MPGLNFGQTLLVLGGVIVISSLLGLLSIKPMKRAILYLNNNPKAVNVALIIACAVLVALILIMRSL